MALLNFKMGNWSTKFIDTTQTPIVPGTVYITKNEGGMYVDTDDNKRIRISGDIIQYESVGDPKIKPPFSTDVLYYFIKENALMKWNGTTWVQLNSVSDVQKNIDALTETVNDNSGKISTLESKIADLEEKDTTLNDAIVANQEAIASNDTELADLTNRMNEVVTKANTTANDLGTLQSTVNTLSGIVTTHGNDIEDLKPRVSAIETEQTTQNDNISAAQTQANKGVADAAAAKKAADDAAATADTNAGRLTTIEGEGEGSIKKAVADEKTRAITAEAALGTRIDGLVTEIGDSSSGMKKNIADNATAIATNTNSINTISGQIATINGDGEGSIKKAVKDAKEALSTEIDADINAANAMNYIKNISAYTELPAVSDGIHIGDTYVVGDAFNNGDVQYNAGDMLIASSSEEEDANGNIKEGTLSWNHVKTGYDVANEPSLSGASDAISLLSHLGANLGTITFKDGGSGIKATIANNEITLSMEWGTFGEE